MENRNAVKKLALTEGLCVSGQPGRGTRATRPAQAVAASPKTSGPGVGSSPGPSQVGKRGTRALQALSKGERRL